MNERALRSPGFRPGSPIRLIDGQEWVFPGPEGLSAAGQGVRSPGSPPDPTYEALLAAWAESEDEAERRRAELALGIYLLGCNYSLSPDDYQELLESPSGDPRGVAVQRAFRDLAVAHVRHRRPRPEARPCPRGRVRAFLHRWHICLRLARVHVPRPPKSTPGETC